ncbi:MAG: hypothetical protein PVG49_11205 [Desulfobacteraceae bacterium]|jgi:methyl-accepting chemotaxis protein
MIPRKRSRRRMFPVVDRSLQYRLLAIMLIYGSVLVTFLMLCFFVPDVIRMEEETRSMEERAVAADRILHQHARVWPAALALICLIGLHSFREFHRLIGPLFRFRWAFDQVKNGNLAFRVRLRRGDHLHKEETLFNEMLDSLSCRLNEITTTLRSVENDLKHTPFRMNEEASENATWMAEHVERIQCARRAAETFLVMEDEDRDAPLSDQIQKAGTSL